MLKNKKNYRKKIFDIILIITIAVCFYQGFINITYANANIDQPNVIVTINSNGQTSCTGSLLGETSWYPGKTDNGVIRIYNHFRPVMLNSLGLEVMLNSTKSSEDRSFVYKSFLNHMNMSLERGKFLFFNETLFENISFMDLCGNNMDAGDGIIESVAFNGIKIPGNDSIDLKYTIHMGEDSGDELENLNASVGLRLQLEEKIETE